MTDYETRVLRHMREYYPADIPVPTTAEGRIDMTRIDPGVLNVAMGFALGEMMESLMPRPKAKPAAKRK